MLLENDSSKEIIERGPEIPLNLEKIIAKTNFQIDLNLIDWKKAGLRTSISVEGLGYGYFNEQPYSTRETALREYRHVLTQVQEGNYSLELYKKNKLKLSLTKSSQIKSLK